MDQSAGKISPCSTITQSGEQSIASPTKIQRSRTSLRCCSSSSPSSSSSSLASGYPHFPHQQILSSSDEVDYKASSGGGVLANKVLGFQNKCTENALTNSLSRVTDVGRDSRCPLAPFKRRRGSQSRKVLTVCNSSRLYTGGKECHNKKKTSFSALGGALSGDNGTSPHRKKSVLRSEGTTAEKEHVSTVPGTFLVRRGRQSVASYTALRLQPLEVAVTDTTVPVKRFVDADILPFTVRQRKIRLWVASLLLFVGLVAGVALHSLYKEKRITAVAFNPISTWLSQKVEVFYQFEELSAIVIYLLSECRRRFVSSILSPVDEIPGFLDLRLRAASFFSHDRLWFTRTGENSTASAVSPFPTIEELQREFSQYAAGRVPAADALREHSKEFEKEIIGVTEDVYVAVGFGLANCVIINAPTGLILIDTMESTSAMAAVWRAWMQLPEAKIRRRSNRPVSTRRRKRGRHMCSNGINGTIFAGCRREKDFCTGNGLLFRDNDRSCGSSYGPREAREWFSSEICATLLCKQKKRIKGSQSTRFAKGSPAVKAIIYTHFHTDHVFGAAAVVQPDTEVHAYWLTYAEMSKVFTLTAGTTYRRSMRQFGVFVDKHDFLNAGIGPALHYSSREEIGTVLPTHIMYGERKTLEVAGMELEMIHAPGESKDQLVVWLPKEKLLIGADNVYKSMPNIYAIRGTETRNCNDWIASLDMMRSLQPEFLVLGHTRPLRGREYIASTLLAYRDAIQFIHDQTLRYMNKGYYVNDIAHMVKLPPHLASHPFLQPFYGTVPWAVKAIFTHYVGWFSGNPEDLAVLSTQEKAESLLSLAGNVQNLLSHALENLREGHAQRALEFASAAHHVAPASAEAKTLKILALRATAAKQQAATGEPAFQLVPSLTRTPPLLLCSSLAPHTP